MGPEDGAGVSREAHAERTFSHLLDILAEVRDCEGASHSLNRMQKLGLTPEIRSLNALIKASARAPPTRDPHLHVTVFW